MNKKVQSKVEAEFITFFRSLVKEKLNQKERTKVYDKFSELNLRAVELMEVEQPRYCGACKEYDTMLICMECRRKHLEKQKAEFRKMIEEELKELSGTESIEKIERYVKSFEEPKKTKELFESYNVYQLAVLLKLLAKLEDNHSPKVYDEGFNVSKKQFKKLKEIGTLKGCGKMFCAIEGCNEIDESHTAYCVRHQRSTHMICGENWQCNSCKKKRGLAIPYDKIIIRSSTAGSSKVQCEGCKKIKRIKFMVKYKGKILCSNCKRKKKFQEVGG